MTAYDALLGTISQDGVPVELGNGLNFTGAVTVVRNASTGKIDVDIASGGGGSGDVTGPGASVDDRIAGWVGTGGDTLQDLGYTVAGVIAAAVAAGPVAGGAPVNVTKAAASAGTDPDFARQDHKHDVSTAAPGAVSLAGVAAAEGASTSLARADHTHSLTGQLPYASLATGTAGRWLTVNASGVVIDSDVAISSKTISYSAADAVAVNLTLRKSRGTSGSPAAHNADDSLGELLVQGHDGSAYYTAGQVSFEAAQAGGTGKRARLVSKVHDGTQLATVSKSERKQVATTDGTLTNAFTYAVAADETIALVVRVHGHGPSNKKIHREWSFRGRRQASGNVAIWGASVEVFALQRDDADWDVGHTFNTGTQEIEIWVLGEAATNITWDVDVSYSRWA